MTELTASRPSQPFALAEPAAVPLPAAPALAAEAAPAPRRRPGLRRLAAAVADAHRAAVPF